VVPQSVLILKWLLSLTTISLAFLLLKILFFTSMVCSNTSPPVVDSIDITPDIVFNKVMNLQNGKSPGPDGWPIQLIKSVGEFISVPLFIIFNKSFFDGVLPKDWKSAHVTPIHKKGVRNIVSNYRLVSLTSFIVK